VLQLMPQFVPSHVALPFVGALQTVQLGPHAVGSVLATHALPHA
jgi:hypothetical protein